MRAIILVMAVGVMLQGCAMPFVPEEINTGANVLMVSAAAGPIATTAAARSEGLSALAILGHPLPYIIQGGTTAALWMLVNPIAGGAYLVGSAIYGAAILYGSDLW